MDEIPQLVHAEPQNLDQVDHPQVVQTGEPTGLRESENRTTRSSWRDQGACGFTKR